MQDCIDRYDAVALGQLLQQGEFTASELLEVVLQRIAQRNPALNVIAQPMEEAARAQAASWRKGDPSSLVSGVPILLKDLLADVAGMPTLCGSRICRELPIPTQDAELTRRYRAAGLIFAGKTTLPEWGLVPYSESQLYGITRNPWDINRTPGGSSGGSGAAVAARMVPLAHGGDGGGSIRIPASNCGLFGLKPGRGRSPLVPGFAELWQGFVTEHVLTRSVRDSAAMLDVMLTPYPSPDADFRSPLYHVAPPPAQGYMQAMQAPLRPLRIAYTLQPFTGGTVCDDARQAVMQSVQLLLDLGHHVAEAHPPLASPDTLNEVMATVLMGSLAHGAQEWQERTGRAWTWRDVEPATWALTCRGRQLNAGAMAWARETALRQSTIMEQFHQQWDVLLTPTMNQPPALVGSLALPASQEALSRTVIGRLGLHSLLKLSPLIQQGIDRTMHYMGWSAVANMTGEPSMSVPQYWTKPSSTAPAGLPIGTMYTGRMGDELTLLQLALQLEQAQPWWQQAPVLG